MDQRGGVVQTSGAAVRGFGRLFVVKPNAERWAATTPSHDAIAGKLQHRQLTTKHTKVARLRWRSRRLL
jgi:hypothetical protein